MKHMELEVKADEQTILTKRDQSKENSMISKRDI